MALKEYRIWRDSSNVYEHVTGEGFDGDEQLNGIETLRAILIHAFIQATEKYWSTERNWTSSQRP